MLGNHKKAVLQFSGGADSVAALYLARPYLDRIEVHFGDTGAVFPHVRQFVQETCDRLGARLLIVRPAETVQAFTAREGLPSDIVPVEASAEMAPFLPGRKGPLLQSYMRCCGAMLFWPLQNALHASGATLVIRGSKAADRRVGVPDGHVEDGIEYRSPLWHWTKADVRTYLDREGVQLPTHYATVDDSLDCWICTAHLTDHGAAKIAYLRAHYPDLWPTLRGRLAAVKAALSTAMDAAGPALAFADIGDDE